MKKWLILLSSLICINLFANVNYNVFVTLDNNAKNEVTNISKGLKKVGINSLYNKGYVIHMTLYLTEYKKEAFNDIKKIVDEIAKKQKQFDVEFYRLRKTATNWYMLDAKTNPEIQNLADIVAVKLNRIRATDAKVPDWAKSIPEKVKSFEVYGSPNVFTSFDPHITLLTPEDSAKIDKFHNDYKFKNFNSTITGIGIAEVDNLGQAKDILYHVNLNK